MFFFNHIYIRPSETHIHILFSFRTFHSLCLVCWSWKEVIHHQHFSLFVFITCLQIQSVCRRHTASQLIAVH